jgi:hypothetical protein
MHGIVLTKATPLNNFLLQYLVKSTVGVNTFLITIMLTNVMLIRYLIYEVFKIIVIVFLKYTTKSL